MLISIPGALLGIVVFLALRPLVASFPLGDLTWYADAIVPPLLPAALVLGAVPIVGVAAAVVSLRRMSISPLGVARRGQAGPPGLLADPPRRCRNRGVRRLAVAGHHATPRSGTDRRCAVVLRIVAGIAVLGPLLTSLIGRVLARGGGPSGCSPVVTCSTTRAPRSRW